MERQVAACHIAGALIHQVVQLRRYNPHIGQLADDGGERAFQALIVLTGDSGVHPFPDVYKRQRSRWRGRPG